MELRIDAHPDPMMGLVPLFTAIDAGLFAKRGIEPVFVQRTAVQAIEDMRADRMDLTFSGPTLTIMARERFGLASRFVATAALRGSYGGRNADFMNIIARKDVSIARPGDFEGKRLAAFALDGGITHSAPLYLFNRHGIDVSSVQWVPMPFHKMPDALAAGEIDVAVCVEPLVTIMLRRGLGYAVDEVLGEGSLAMASTGNPSLVSNWWTTREAYARNPALFAATAEALAEAVDAVYRDPSAALDAMARHTGQDSALLREIGFDTTLFHPFGMDDPAVKAVMADHARWHAAELETRADFALRCAWAHGTAGLRTHVDAAGPQARMSWDVMQALRARWAGRIRLQMVAMAPMDTYLGAQAEAFVRRVAESGGVLGGVTRIPGLPPAAARQRLALALDALFGWAGRYGLDVDLHVDESCEPAADSLREVARAAQAKGVRGYVVCGHCCSLAVQPEAVREQALDLCLEAGLAIVSLPLVNLFLQDRSAGRTPRLRGLAPLHEIAGRGIPVALASDNCGDAFHAYGDYDPLEVLREGVRNGHLDGAAADWSASVTATPARLMRHPARGMLEKGGAADFIVFDARSMPELLARPQSDRIVVRGGRPLAESLPSFAELDCALAEAGHA